ncbi:MAG TPA: hypothetical protein VFD58_11790 [Blastocatellia bacterium]|nr:hypothetical protein [Blastocatellia bacterium]
MNYPNTDEIVAALQTMLLILRILAGFTFILLFVAIGLFVQSCRSEMKLFRRARAAGNKSSLNESRPEKPASSSSTGLPHSGEKPVMPACAVRGIK